MLFKFKDTYKIPSEKHFVLCTIPSKLDVYFRMVAKKMKESLASHNATTKCLQAKHNK